LRSAQFHFAARKHFISHLSRTAALNFRGALQPMFSAAISLITVDSQK
jgi:hypothetical protein